MEGSGQADAARAKGGAIVTGCGRCLTCDDCRRREPHIAGLTEHVRAKLPHVGEATVGPRGCVVLLALDILCAEVAIGPFDVPELGIKVWS